VLLNNSILQNTAKKDNADKKNIIVPKQLL